MVIAAPISGLDPPKVSLSGVLVTGAGSQINFSRPRRNFSMQVVWTSNPTAVAVALQGSIDGVNWFTVATFDTASGNINNDIISADFVVVLYARANLLTLTGGTSPTVTATILGYDAS